MLNKKILIQRFCELSIHVDYPAARYYAQDSQIDLALKMNLLQHHGKLYVSTTFAYLPI